MVVDLSLTTFESEEDLGSEARILRNNVI